MRRLEIALVVAASALLAGCGGGGSTTTTKPSGARAQPPAAAVERASASAARERAALRRLAALGRPVFCGGSRPYAALTFDDGPGPYTPLALKILRRAHVPATFFLVGRNVEPYAHLVRREHRRGDALGNHSWTHPYLPSLSAPAMEAQLADTQRAVAEAGHTPVAMFRPPYGAHDAAIDASARRLGMVQVLWSVDSGDSQGADYAAIARNVLRGLRPGSIVLLHENRGQTIRALKFHILPALRRRHLKLVTVPQLLALNPPSARQLELGPRGCAGPAPKGLSADA